MTRGDPLPGDHEVLAGGTVTPDAAPDGHEVLAHGSEDPPRRVPRGVLAVGAACALAGFAAGVLVSGHGLDAGVRAILADGRSAAPQASTSRPVPVAAGAVTASTPALPDRFGLSLFNWGDRPLRAEVVSLPGWLPALADRTTTTIAPHSWGLAGFAVPVRDCSATPGHVRVVVVEVRTGRRTTSYVVPLSEPADRVLRAHHDQVCPAPRGRAKPVTGLTRRR